VAEQIIFGRKLKYLIMFDFIQTGNFYSNIDEISLEKWWYILFIIIYQQLNKLIDNNFWIEILVIYMNNRSMIDQKSQL
jgi:hypothetical protein